MTKPRRHLPQPPPPLQVALLSRFATSAEARHMRQDEHTLVRAVLWPGPDPCTQPSTRIGFLVWSRGRLAALAVAPQNSSLYKTYAILVVVHLATGVNYRTVSSVTDIVYPWLPCLHMTSLWLIT
jgi:hypothetical protein